MGQVRLTRLWAVVWAAVWTVVLAGCATTKGGPSAFTSAEELKKLTAGPKPQQVFTTKTADVTLWTFLGPFPEEISLAPHEQESPAGKMIVGEASKRGAIATASLACAARELAHFVAEKQERPPLMLQEAIAGRCAVGTAQLSWSWLQMETGDATDESLVDLAKPKLSGGLEGLSARTFVGAAFSRSGTKGVLALVRAEARGSLEPVSVFPDAEGWVTLHGTADASAADLVGVITRGDLGAAACVDLRQRALPQYDLRCQVQSTDSTAWISVATRAKGRLLSQELQRVLVWPSRHPSTSWNVPQIIPAGVPATVEGLAAQVNVLRAGLGLRPLEVSQQQTADMHEVAPFLFQAVLTADGTTADQLGLGIIAGWHVEKDITWGNFCAEVAEHDDGSLLLTHAMSSPSTRALLFDPAASLIGMGIYREAGGLGVVFSAYRGLQMANFPASVEPLVEQLNAARAKLSRGPVKWTRLPGNGELDFEGALAARKMEVSDALQGFLEATVAATGRGVQGFSVEMESLDQVAWPAELINAEHVELSLVAAPVRPSRAPWTHFVVLMARPEPQ